MSADEEKPLIAGQRTPSYDEIALCAYFIALERSRRGEEGDALKDWSEAERRLGLRTGESSAAAGTTT